MKQPEASQTKKRKNYAKWSYWLAWLSFGITVGSAILNILKDNQPPSKDDY